MVPLLSMSRPTKLSTATKRRDGEHRGRGTGKCPNRQKREAHMFAHRQTRYEAGNHEIDQAHRAGHQDKIIYAAPIKSRGTPLRSRFAGSARRAACDTGGSRGDEQFLIYEIARENAGDSGRGD